MKVDSFEVVEKRVNSFLKKIKKIHKNKTVLVVSHKEVTRQFIKSILSKYKNTPYNNIPVRSGSIQFFDFDKDGNIQKSFTNKIIYPMDKNNLIGDSFRFVEAECKKKKPRKVNEIKEKMDLAARNYLKKGKSWKGFCKSMFQVGINEGLVTEGEIAKSILMG